MHIPTHLVAGWLLAQPLPSLRDRRLIALAAVLPDIDGLPLLGGVELYHRHHHTFGHNAFLGGAMVLGAFAFGTKRALTGLLAALAFASHIVMDLLGSGSDWPIPLLWPLSHHKAAFPPPFQWELASWQNYVFALILFGAMVFRSLKSGRSVVEVFSPKADSHFVGTLRKWFGHARA